MQKLSPDDPGGVLVTPRCIIQPTHTQSTVRILLQTHSQAPSSPTHQVHHTRQHLPWHVRQAPYDMPMAGGAVFVGLLAPSIPTQRRPLPLPLHNLALVLQLISTRAVAAARAGQKGPAAAGGTAAAGRLDVVQEDGQAIGSSGGRIQMVMSELKAAADNS